MNSNATLPAVALLNEKPVWMKPTPEIQALHGQTIVVEHGQSKRPGYLRVGKADPASTDAGKCSVAFWQAWLEGEPAWADTGSAIPTAQSRSSHEYLSPDALGLIGDSADGPQVAKLRLVIPPG
jgi:hypothetical protein